MQAEMNKLVRKIRRLRYDVVKTGDTHWRVDIPGYTPVFMPCTPGHGRAMANVLAELKKRGIHVKP